MFDKCTRQHEARKALGLFGVSLPLSANLILDMKQFVIKNDYKIYQSRLHRHLHDIITLNMYANYTDNSEGNESVSSSDDDFI